MGLSGTMNGSGLCTGQTIAPGTLVERGTALIVDFQTSAEIEAAQAAAQAQLEAEQNALLETESTENADVVNE